MTPMMNFFYNFSQNASWDFNEVLISRSLKKSDHRMKCILVRVTGTINIRLDVIYQSSEAKKDNSYVKISLQHLHTKGQFVISRFLHKKERVGILIIILVIILSTQTLTN